MKRACGTGRKGHVYGEGVPSPCPCGLAAPVSQRKAPILKAKEFEKARTDSTLQNSASRKAPRRQIARNDQVSRSHLPQASLIGRYSQRFRPQGRPGKERHSAHYSNAEPFKPE